MNFHYSNPFLGLNSVKSVTMAPLFSPRTVMSYPIKETLKNYFGHDGFRPLQQEAVETILNRRDLLMILPTGGGKSLCYQLPALLLEGLTVVVSPLLALMHDQVTALQAMNVHAAMLSSMQDESESKAVYRDLYAGKTRLLYVAPERFKSENFVAMLQELPLALFVIDEAHCVSEWGHEFREDYRKLDRLKKLFPAVPIAAFTATATQRVAQDITANLGLNAPHIIKGTIFRPNLFIEVQRRQKDGKAQLTAFLNQHKNESGIIYTLSRKNTETLAAFLQSKGFKAKPFHAGLDNSEKKSTFEAFVNDDIEIVVATIAFGMGIDKSNIRFVVHMQLPKTLESFYQEIGRAGRDGLESHTLLLFSASDVVQREQMMQEIPEGPYKTHALNKLEQMASFSKAHRCRHQNIAAYFEDSIGLCDTSCDICTAPDIEKVDITEDAQKFLSAVYRLDQRFGQAYVIDVLRGSVTEKILGNKHDKLSVYGIVKTESRGKWQIVAEHLLEIGALARGEHRELLLTPLGIDLLKGNATTDIEPARLIEVRTQKAAKSVDVEDMDFEMQHFEVLRQLRKELASEAGIPPYMVFSDKTLKEMAHALPSTKEDMLDIHGVGEQKFKKFGQAFLTACQNL